MSLLLLSSALSRHGRRLGSHASARAYAASATPPRRCDDDDDDHCFYDDERRRRRRRGRDGERDGGTALLPRRRQSVRPEATTTPSRSFATTTKTTAATIAMAARPHRSRCRATETTTTTTTTARQFHATARTEILPFVAAGVLGLTVIYANRALNQMDRDMMEYEEKLDEYEAAMGIDPTTARRRRRRGGDDVGRSSSDRTRFFAGGTLAIDIGTTRAKFSHLPSSPPSGGDGGAARSPAVCVDREGHRSTPSLIWLPPKKSRSGDGGEVPLHGRQAEARYYDSRDGTVLHPLLRGRDGGDDDDDAAIAALRRAVREAASDALDQALGGGSVSGGGGSGGDAPLFASSSRPFPGSYDARPVFTYPPSPTGGGGTTTGGGHRLERYRRIAAGLSSPDAIAAFVPEPVAIVAGAEHYGLLPPRASAGRPPARGGGGGRATPSSVVLVVDAGGTSTRVSLVSFERGGEEGGEVTYSATLPLGGDTPVDLLVSRLAGDFFGPSGSGSGGGDGDDDDENDDDLDDSYARPRLDYDPAALQRLRDASAAAMRELSNKTRTEVNVPYLTMDAGTRQPRHLRTEISRNVVDADFEAWVGSVLVPRLTRRRSRGDGRTVLSPALPPPADLSALLASAIARSLEVASLTPFDLRAMLLVGGGARVPLVRESMARGVGYLAGDAYAGERLIVPEGEMCDELAVLGAAVWGARRGK